MKKIANFKNCGKVDSSTIDPYKLVKVFIGL